MPIGITDWDAISLGNGFILHDVDDAGDPNYHGYVRFDGRWVIAAWSASYKTVRFASTTARYEAAWAERSNLVYGYISDKKLADKQIY